MAKVFFGEFRIGFFAEGGDLHGHVSGVETESGGWSALDVSIRRARPCRLDPDSDEGVGLGGDGEAVAEDGLEGIGVLNELVRGQDGHGGVGITCGDESDAESDGGSGIAFGGFGENVFGGEFGRDFANRFFLERVG